MNIPYAEVDQIAKQVPRNTLHITLKDALRLSKPLQEFYESEPRYKTLIDTALRHWRECRGMPPPMQPV